MPISPPLEGALLFARYAFMPNRLGLCGGTTERGLFEASCAGYADPGLRAWAIGFEGAYPYLALIAHATEHPDPLDYAVVEAYWLGTSLLTGVSAAPLYASLRERFAPRLSARLLNLVLGKVPAGAQPCHAFHVLEVCRRTGALAEQVDVLDNCRISWGQVQTLTKEGLWVSVQPLRLINGQLTLALPQLRFVQHLWDGYGFIADVKPGDWISIHWGWACDRLTSQQVHSLSQSTQHHLALANQTL